MVGFVSVFARRTLNLGIAAMTVPKPTLNGEKGSMQGQVACQNFTCIFNYLVPKMVPNPFVSRIRGPALI